MPVPKPMYARVGVGQVLADLSHGELLIGSGVSHYQRKKASVKLFRGQICRAIGWPADPSHERLVSRYSTRLAKRKEGYLKKERGGRGQPTTYTLSAKFRGAVDSETTPEVPSEAIPERTDSASPVPVQTTRKTTTTSAGVGPLPPDTPVVVVDYLRGKSQQEKHDYAKAVPEAHDQFGPALVKQALAELGREQLSTLPVPLAKWFWGIIKRLAKKRDQVAEEEETMAREPEGPVQLRVREQAHALQKLRGREGPEAVARFLADQGDFRSDAEAQFRLWSYADGNGSLILAPGTKEAKAGSKWGFTLRRGSGAAPARPERPQSSPDSGPPNDEQDEHDETSQRASAKAR